MKKKIIIIAGLILMSAIQAYSQVAESFTLTVNNDNSPIEATFQDEKIVVELKESDVVNFIFGKFSTNPENVTIQVTNQTNGKTISSRNTNKLEKKNEFDLIISDLNLSSENDDEIYLVSLTDGNDRQLIFRFKVAS